LVKNSPNAATGFSGGTRTIKSPGWTSAINLDKDIPENLASLFRAAKIPAREGRDFVLSSASRNFFTVEKTLKDEVVTNASALLAHLRPRKTWKHV